MARLFNYLKDYNSIYELSAIIHKIEYDINRLRHYEKIESYLEQKLTEYTIKINSILNEMNNENIGGKILNELLSPENVEYSFINKRYKADASLTGVEFEKKVNEIFEIEDMVSREVSKIWSNHLTDFNAFTQGQDFNFVVHSCYKTKPSLLPGTNGYIDNEYKNTTFISCSLITGKQIELYNDNIGLSFPIDQNNFICADEKDCATRESKNRSIRTMKQVGNLFIDSGFSHTKDCVTSITTPREIELKNIALSEKINGEKLNNQNSRVYNEVVLNKITSRPNGIVIISSGSDLLLEEYLVALEMKKIYGVDIKVINKSIYRKKEGLKPFTNKDSQDYFNLSNNYLDKYDYLFSKISDIDSFIVGYKKDILEFGTYDQNIKYSLLNMLEELKEKFKSRDNQTK